jgi:hypothetical protein
MCRPRTERVCAIVGALTVFTALAGCSDIYMDRRDGIALGAGDAVAANQMAQMYDPWPAHSGNVNYAANGQKMQSAIERYRTNVVTQPVAPMGLMVANSSPQTTQTGGAQNGPPPSSATAIATPSGAPTTTTTTVSGQ